MIEHLGVVGAAIESRKSLPPKVLYSTVKLSLDMATSFLLFCGLYAPTYHKRCERLRALAKAGAAEFDPPFSLREFADMVDWATHYKLSPNSAPDSADRQVWMTTVTFAAALWQWELARLTDLQAGDRANAPVLMWRWMRRQTFYDRARGWAALLRRCEWNQTIACWPRWARLAWQASPRHWVYRAASELFFALPALAEANGRGAAPLPLRGDQIRRWLPLCRSSERTNLAKCISLAEWRDLASDVLWNYDAFLKETRS
jgi:hypothetical protein